MSVPDVGDKQALRAWARACASSFSDAYNREAAGAICAHVRSLDAYRAAHVVFCFVGTAREPDTRPLLEAVLQDGKTLCVPRCEAPGMMTARRVDCLEQLVRGAWGILEPSADAPVVLPEDIDLCVTPCLAADETKNRLGQGGGYYDRFLPRLKATATTALVCREPLVVPRLPLCAHDVPCTVLVTERRVLL
jgi:5-formyltetrahydrofolate cyclo-ligase